jgi:hypothetical protein
VQVSTWCKNSWEDMTVLLGDFDDAAEFELQPADQAVLRKLLSSDDFSPMLDALDTNDARVLQRELEAQQRADFKELKDKTAAYRLHREIDEGTEFDYEGDYAERPHPKAAITYDEWLQVDKLSLAGATDLNSLATYGSTIASILNFIHQQAWLVDHLMHHQPKHSVQAGSDTNDTLLSKYPFLEKCDDYVWLVPNGKSIMLARTAAVSARTHILQSDTHTHKNPTIIPT